MKKIIGGKLYNTDTATRVYSYCNGLSNRDFNNMTEHLYRKKTGEFFLHGWGGAMSKYREQCDGNMWSGGESIIPLTIEEAKEWLERYADADVYIECFGEVAE